MTAQPGCDEILADRADRMAVTRRIVTNLNLVVGGPASRLALTVRACAAHALRWQQAGRTGPLKGNHQMSTKRKPNSTKPKAHAIYHVMRADEDFDDTADILFQLVKSAAASHPGEPRHLYFDVEGHRNSKGGYDGEAMDVYEFIIKYLAVWLTEFPGPLSRYRNDDQREDVPEQLVTQLLDSDAEVDEMIAEARTAGRQIMDPRTSEWVQPDGTRTRRFGR